MMDANAIVHVIQWLVVWECAQRMEEGKGGRIILVRHRGLGNKTK